jgi:plastocyanin
MTPSLRRSGSARVIGRCVLVPALLAACGGGGGGPGPGPSGLTVAKATPSGDGQSAAPGAALANPIRIVVLRGGAPEAEAAVTWSTSEGSLNPASDSTDANGIAGSTWTLGPAAGAQSAQAAVSGAAGSPQTFSATAVVPGPPGSSISVINNQFNPADVTVPAGTTVTWTWSTAAANHNVTPDDTEPPRSGNPRNGPFTFSHTFDTPGTYGFYCEIHGGPGGAGMSGTVTVQ